MNDSFYVTEMTLKRHLFTGAGDLTTLEALRMAQERDPRIQKTTIFQVSIHLIEFNSLGLHSIEEAFLVPSEHLWFSF